MSKCISSHGEYSEHTFGVNDAPIFTCGRCWSFDEDAAVAEIERLLADREVEHGVRAVALAEDDEEWVRRVGKSCLVAASEILRALDGAE